MPMDDANLKALTAFAEVAAEYCAFIDLLRQGRPENLYRTLEALLPRLHQAILPVCCEMPQQKHPEWDCLAMTHEQWLEVASLVQGTVGKETAALFEWHTETTLPDTSGPLDSEAFRADMLFDDLSDIYRHLRNGLTLWKMGVSDSRAEATWAWRHTYEIQWAENLFRAMLTVHEARYQLFAD